MGLQGTFPGEPTFLPLMGAGYENCPHYDGLSEVFNAINIFFLKYALTLVCVTHNWLFFYLLPLFPFLCSHLY